LREENADILTVYDDHGLYGHPDHIQVHRVGRRAGELAGTKKVYEYSVDRDALIEIIRLASESDDLPELPEDFGVPGDVLTTRVDIAEYAERKRKAMQAHASQINESSFFLQMPPDRFRAAFGTESFTLVGAPQGTSETDLFEGV
ncbi:MAG TPA: GlcNAc-PI de-N-acetylase, partial [Mycobacteriales bacterium]|nr:GlcNAc-PI de-N-acetylase [Mycobacteriales bacterium]